MSAYPKFRRALIKPLFMMPIGDDIPTVFVLVMGYLSQFTLLLVPFRIRDKLLKEGGLPSAFRVFIFYDGPDNIPHHFSVELWPGGRQKAGTSPGWTAITGNAQSLFCGTSTGCGT